MDRNAIVGLDGGEVGQGATGLALLTGAGAHPHLVHDAAPKTHDGRGSAGDRLGSMSDHLTRHVAVPLLVTTPIETAALERRCDERRTGKEAA